MYRTSTHRCCRAPPSPCRVANDFCLRRTRLWMWLAIWRLPAQNVQVMRSKIHGPIAEGSWKDRSRAWIVLEPLPSVASGAVVRRVSIRVVSLDNVLKNLLALVCAAHATRMLHFGGDLWPGSAEHVPFPHLANWPNFMYRMHSLP